MYYEIDENNAVKIYDGINPEPFWYQPHYPNEDAFDSKEEATAWAELAMASQTDETAPFPPNGKGLEGLPRPTKEEMVRSRIEAMGIDLSTLKQMLNDVG
jgi:hypothetical protein